MPDQHRQRLLELARRNSQHYTFRYRSLLLHWLARSFMRPAPVEIEPLPLVEPGQVAVTWGGHATVLVRYHRIAVVCDPVLARSVSGVPRERASGLGAEALAAVDLALISHAAPDHLDLGSLARLSRTATVVVPPRAGARVSPLGFARLVELAPGCSLQHREVQVTAEQVRHGERGSPAQSYVMRGDGPTVYFCGGSGYFPGFADIGRRHWPDVALLPVGGYSPRSFRARHMSPLDALYAFEDLRARVMVPIRYGTFALSYERLNDPERWLAELVSERRLERFVVRLSAGESRVFVPPAAASGYHTGRFDVGVESGAQPAQTALVAELRARAAARHFPLRRLSQPPAGAEGLIPAGPDDVVSPMAPSAAATAARRPPAMIVDQDDDTRVFDRTGDARLYSRAAAAMRRSGREGEEAGEGDEADGDHRDGKEEDDQDASRGLALDGADPEPDPLHLRGSR